MLSQQELIFIERLLLTEDAECLGKYYSEKEDVCKICGQRYTCKGVMGSNDTTN